MLPFFCKHINLLGVLENKHRLRQSKSLPEDAASFDHNWIGTDVITIDFEHQNYNRNQTTAGGIQFWYFILCPLKAQLVSKGLSGILNSFKKWTKKSTCSTMKPWLVFVGFFGRIEDTKKSFWN